MSEKEKEYSPEVLNEPADYGVLKLLEKGWVNL